MIKFPREILFNKFVLKFLDYMLLSSFNNNNNNNKNNITNNNKIILSPFVFKLLYSKVNTQKSKKINRWKLDYEKKLIFKVIWNQIIYY